MTSELQDTANMLIFLFIFFVSLSCDVCQLLPGGGGDFRHLPSELYGCRTKTNILLEISPGFPTKTTNNREGTEL